MYLLYRVRHQGCIDQAVVISASSSNSLPSPSPFLLHPPSPYNSNSYRHLGYIFGNWLSQLAVRSVLFVSADCADVDRSLPFLLLIRPVHQYDSSERSHRPR